MKIIIVKKISEGVMSLCPFALNERIASRRQPGYIGL